MKSLHITIVICTGIAALTALVCTGHDDAAAAMVWGLVMLAVVFA